jgi:hypothetical protein
MPSLYIMKFILMEVRSMKNINFEDGKKYIETLKRNPNYKNIFKTIDEVPVLKNIIKTPNDNTKLKGIVKTTKKTY